ncbi:MAG: IS630 family transposase [Emticicia sp.]|nr:IS630 family transposase [Emticicia sp.]
MREWVIPAAGAEFVCAMEDVLDVYARVYNEENPVVCFDESPKQLVSEVRKPYIDQHGVKHEDCEYKREGAAELFMIVEPLGKRREVSVEEDHTGNTWARKIAQIAEEMYPNAKKITLIQDNLSAHKKYNLYNVFEPNRARAIIDRIEFIYTPKHGSWLNIAECELSVIKRQALDKRFASKQELKIQVDHWVEKRNNMQKGIDWQFKTKDARIKLKKLYPTVLT